MGNNFPDLDVLYASFTLNSARLGNLLHHRGHTHTVLVVVFLGLLIAAAGDRLLLRGFKKLAPADRGYFWLAALLGPVLHVVMDSLNNYGVHPFWPVSNRWFYGDTLFIIEPLLWVTLFPVVYFATQRRRVRWVIETLCVGFFTALWIFPLTKWYSNVAILVLGAAVWLVSSKLKPKRRADAALWFSLGVIAVFSSVSFYSRGQIGRQTAELFPSVTLHDVVLSPYPANPLCWSLVTVETFGEETKYRLRRGKFAPFPALVSADQCPQLASRGSTAYLTSVPTLWGPQYDWEGQYQATAFDLKEFLDYSCRWQAFLRFSRAPFLQEEAGSLWAGDLRFDYGPEIGFSEIEIPEERPPCRGWVPPWDAPRKEIF